MTIETEKPANWYFSFGHGHDNFNRYVKIHGTSAECRSEMFRRFGAAWSMQYEESRALDVIERWGWTEIV